MRAERLLALGRVALALAALVVIWLDPGQPARYPHFVYLALVLYACYAIVVASVAWRATALPAHLPLGTHVVDLLGFPALMFFAEGPGSPFFLYFVFALLASAMRWQWRGTLWTTAVLLATYIGMGLVGTHVLREAGFAMSTFVLRSTFLCVTAVITGAFGAYHHRVRREMLTLASWPREVPGSTAELMRQSLAHACTVVDTARAVAVWEEGEEPWLHVAEWNAGAFEHTRLPPGQWEPLVAEPLAEAAFLCSDAAAAAPEVLCDAAGSFRQAVSPLHTQFRQRFGIGAVLSAPLHGQAVLGRLFLLDMKTLAADDLMLAELIAGQVTSRLDRLFIAERERENAVASERVRLARDLHDGLLQSLTAAALEIEALHGRPSLEAAGRLQRVQRLIAAEQRDLNWLIRCLRPGTTRSGAELADRLADLASKIEELWGARVEVQTDGLPEILPGSMAYHAYLMVNEAVANAVRHGGASAVHVRLGFAGEQVQIHIVDDGRGFPFKGHYSDDALVASRLGPATLSQRARALGGTLSIDSSDSGAEIRISVPAQPQET